MNNIKLLKEKYPEGTKIRLIYMMIFKRSLQALSVP